MNIFNNIPVIVLLIISAIFVMIGDYFAKMWSIDRKYYYYILTLLFYYSGPIFYIPTLLRETLVITSLFWILFTTMGFLFVGIIMFKESFTINQMIGIVFGIISIIFLTVFK